MKDIPDKFYDLAVVDPPYGIGYSKRKSKTKSSLIQYNPKNWDNQSPNQEYWNQLFRVSKNQIVWGGNYFDLPPSRCFIVWDKCQPEGLDQAMCEMAWTSFNSSAKIYKTSIQQIQFTRIHPTQKPVKLYEWLLMNYAKEGDKILDTHGGSQSSRIACYNLGYELDIIELDQEYFDQGNKRFEEHKQQLRLF
jgi:site-specific DNA-methyltransferase (adenine-specific)